MTDSLTLKWGTLKAWDAESESFKSALEALLATPRSVSAAMQRDTPEEKELLLKVIDACDGDIWLDWDDKLVTKEEAKKYVMEYDRDA